MGFDTGSTRLSFLPSEIDMMTGANGLANSAETRIKTASGWVDGQRFWASVQIVTPDGRLLVDFEDEQVVESISPEIPRLSNRMLQRFTTICMDHDSGVLFASPSKRSVRQFLGEERGLLGGLFRKKDGK